MDLEQVLADLEIADAAEVVAPHWEDSVSSLPSAPGFLDAAEITRAREFAGLAPDADPTLHDAAARIAASPQLRVLAWQCDQLLFEHLDYPASPSFREWPQHIAALDSLTGALYLLVALDAIPRMRAIHGSRGIPEGISRATCSHFPTSLRVYQQNHPGQYGVAPRVLYWLRNHTQGELYRLGRLEYMVRPFRGPLVAFRQRHTRDVVALAISGTRFDEEGYLAPDSETAHLCAELQEADDQVSGTPISPCGQAETHRVTLPLREWERALSPGDLILEVHIPAGGDMTPDNCRASMAQALEFFPRYFPEKPFVGFACSSWILSPELAQIYRPDSNMVLWQRELYLYPAFGGRSSLYFVFGEENVDLATAPRDTSLRRALLDHLAGGGSLVRGGGMFMLLEEFDAFGTQVYRRRHSGQPPHRDPSADAPPSGGS